MTSPRWAVDTTRLPATTTMAFVCAPWHLRLMAGNVVNLNRFRKKKAREEKAKQAETNRRLHGRTKAEKERELAERQRAARALEGKRLEPASDDSAAPASPNEESASGPTKA